MKNILKKIWKEILLWDGIIGINLIIASQFFRGLHITFFVGSVVGIVGYIIWNKVRRKKISVGALVTLIIILLIYMLEEDEVIYSFNMLLIKLAVYIGTVIFGVCLIWIAKKEFEDKLWRYFLLSVITLIISFGGIYITLYAMYFPIDMECFQIDQGMSWDQAIMAEDFIYYSADAFFGTNLSEVRIRYIDYMEVYSNEKQIANYSGAIFVLKIAKLMSAIESLLFIVYISIIVLNLQSKKSNESQNV